MLIIGQTSEQLERERAAQPQPRHHNLGFLLSQELAGTGVLLVLLGSCMKGSGGRGAMTHSGSVCEEAIRGVPICF